MNETDKRILNEIQTDFPIVSRPYLELANRLGLSESEVINCVRKLKDRDVIRRIGGNFHSSKLNFASTLCAAKVPDEKIEHFVEVVNRYPGVTHNYMRSHDYNIWFTFIAEDMDTIDKVLQSISAETGVTQIRSLPATKTFKIKVDFEV
ncbi:Nitrite reductase heme biosynthesis G family protein [uncultured Desulfobacterium sp.]|uniref:siroheme decarboxylase n=1 Tax=uncultured Desulfobacterium sp. TaxID=201089 RepID=A0A445MQN5_9BACT|nr:Nitrite reductase heme biosynthesis G family protein [uncultured Desulfobacterium sp.]